MPDTVACYLLVFNFKRLREIQSLTLSCYRKKHSVKSNDDSDNNMERLELEGKCNNTTYLLLEPRVVKMIDTIINLRLDASVREDNPYVFASIDGTVIDLNKSLKKYATDCIAEQPKLLRSTKIRKALASSTQNMNLTTEDKRVLSRFLGHSLATHEKHYNVPDPVIHVTHVSKLLSAVVQNKKKEYVGRSLFNIGPSSRQEESEKKGAEEESAKNDADEEESSCVESE
uniref:Uncharacterized protein n=1 Tax=Cacopsylla melanoneura TaxID=428564 RepID=A0A8D9E8E0_9HEMI